MGNFFVKCLEDSRVLVTHSPSKNISNEGYDFSVESIPKCDTDFLRHDGNNSLYVDEESQSQHKEEERLKALKAESLAYQSDQQSQNELGILHGYSVEDLETKPVAKAQIDWMTSLFALKNMKDADPTNDTPYSSVGLKPHSFEEIYAEKWGL